jgi:hypothetical protein
MKSRNQKTRVAVPSDYYKIFLRKDGNQWRSIAFVFKHDNTPHGVKWNEVRPVAKAAITSLAAIEKRAEATFNPRLLRSEPAESSDGSEWDFQIGKSNLEGGCR